MPNITKIGLAVVDRGKILVVRKRGTNILILPGGKPEQGEEDLATLLREITEELSCSIDEKTITYLGTFSDQIADLANTTVTIRLYGGNLIGNPTPSSEIEHLVWLDLTTPNIDCLAPSLTNSIIPFIFHRDIQSNLKVTHRDTRLQTQSAA